MISHPDVLAAGGVVAVPVCRIPAIWIADYAGQDGDPDALPTHAPLDVAVI